jgi:hypothetical protein
MWSSSIYSNKAVALGVGRKGISSFRVKLTREIVGSKSIGMKRGNGSQSKLIVMTETFMSRLLINGKVSWRAEKKSL